MQCNPPGRCNQALTRLTPGGPQLYEESKVPPLGIHQGNVWGASYDGSGIWVVNDRGLARWDIAAALWTEYTPETTKYALPPDYITASLSPVTAVCGSTFAMSMPCTARCA